MQYAATYSTESLLTSLLFSRLMGLLLFIRWVDGFMITGVASYIGGDWFGVASQIFAASSAFGMATATITVASRELQYMSSIKQLPQVAA